MVLQIGALDAEATRNAKPTDPFYIIHDAWLMQCEFFVMEKKR
jgi:hypothetical protein